MDNSLKNIFAVGELRKRVLFTLAMLAVYRVGSHIPTPGVNKEALLELARQMQGPFAQSYLPLGDLLIAFAHAAPIEQYQRDLDLEEEGLARVGVDERLTGRQQRLHRFENELEEGGNEEQRDAEPHQDRQEREDDPSPQLVQVVEEGHLPLFRHGCDVRLPQRRSTGP